MAGPFVVWKEQWEANEVGLNGTLPRGGVDSSRQRVWAEKVAWNDNGFLWDKWQRSEME
jgi:hypothetical protein